jgi:hypothetical protein
MTPITETQGIVYPVGRKRLRNPVFSKPTLCRYYGYRTNEHNGDKENNLN